MICTNSVHQAQPILPHKEPGHEASLCWTETVISGDNSPILVNYNS